MIQYIIAAGFGLWLGSQSKKSKKSYAHGGEVEYKYEGMKRFDDGQSVVFKNHGGDTDYIGELKL